MIPIWFPWQQFNFNLIRGKLTIGCPPNEDDSQKSVAGAEESQIKAFSLKVIEKKEKKSAFYK